MSAASKRSFILVRLAVASAASVWALEAPGCSGTVINSHNQKNDDAGADGAVSPNAGSPGTSGSAGSNPGRRGSGGVTGSAGFGTAGIIVPGGPLCGNGVVDPGEACDGGNLFGETCYSVTMGAMPYGTLSCLSCMFNVSGCTGGGVGGQGGAGGGFGVAGAAGAAGMLGVDPVAVCYANGGVPDRSNPNNCYYGVEAQRLCTNNFFSAGGICDPNCGCQSCPAQFDGCSNDYDCMQIVTCAQKMGCSRMVDCYQPGICQQAIDSAGGQRGRGAIAAANVMTCSMNSGCPLICSGGVDIPPP